MMGSSSAGSGDQGTSGRRLYCYCQQPFDENKFMVGCELCHQWFHGACIGVSLEQLEEDCINEWFCEGCLKESSDEEAEVNGNYPEVNEKGGKAVCQDKDVLASPDHVDGHVDEEEEVDIPVIAQSKYHENGLDVKKSLETDCKASSIANLEVKNDTTSSIIPVQKVVVKPAPNSPHLPPVKFSNLSVAKISTPSNNNNNNITSATKPSKVIIKVVVDSPKVTIPVSLPMVTPTIMASAVSKRKRSTDMKTTTPSSSPMRNKKGKGGKGVSVKPTEGEELFCLCRTPYDLNRFYIGCDSCKDWFHGSCVGVLEKESATMETYMCPKCRDIPPELDVNTKPLTTEVGDKLVDILKLVKEHKSAEPFLDPVPKGFKKYHQIIKDPMDLKTIEGKLGNKEYPTLSQFIGDMAKMFDNCRYFNGPGSQYTSLAEDLEGFFLRNLKDLRDQLH